MIVYDHSISRKGSVEVETYYYYLAAVVSMMLLIGLFVSEQNIEPHAWL